MDNKELVRRINEALAARNISKAQFYSDCGITSGAYSQWNQNKTSPSRRTIKKIADYLGWSEEYLLLGKEQKKPPEIIGELSPDEEEFISVYRSASPQVQAFLREMIDRAAALSDPQDGETESS